jgi:hypothetical protein
MKQAFIGTMLLVLLAAGLGGGWVAMNYFQPGNVGTPVNAGTISHGRPMECTNINLTARARSTATHVATLPGPGLVRGTFEAQGGFGRVDIFLRVTDPQGLEIMATPREETFEFSFPAEIRGDYTFVFDNRFSLYTSKSIGLYYCLDTGVSPIPTPFGPY